MTNVVDKQSSSTNQGEESSAGVSGETYWKYFKSGGGVCSFILFMLSCLTSEILFCTSDYWLNLWTSTENGRSLNFSIIATINRTERNTSLTIGPMSFLGDGWVLDRNIGIYVYSILIGGVFIFGFLRAAQFYGIATGTSLKLHDNMFHAVIRAPVKFFDENPLGQ